LYKEIFKETIFIPFAFFQKLLKVTEIKLHEEIIFINSEASYCSLCMKEISLAPTKGVREVENTA